MAFGGLIAAIIAAICCIGPTILGALGIGFGAVSIFVASRPLFIILTIIFLSIAFIYAYKKRRISCKDGTCKFVSGSRGSKVILWIVTIISLGLITFPYWFPLISRVAAL